MASEGAGTGQDLVRSFESLGAEFSAEIAGLHGEAEIRLAQSRYLGKKGRATELMKLLGRIPQADRPAVGVAANRARETIEKLVEERLASLAESALASELARSGGRDAAWTRSSCWHPASTDPRTYGDRADLPRHGLRGAHRTTH
jgi:hypothetical protein